MGDIHIRQIRAFLEKEYGDIVDMSDVAKKPKDEQASLFLTRTLAALGLRYIANIAVQDSASAITDGFQDNGIDALHYDPLERVIYIVQSKWHHDGGGSIELGDVQKFIAGFKDLLNARWDRFNKKVQKSSAILDAALDDARTRIVLMITHTGQEALSAEATRALQDVLDENNDPTEIVSLVVHRQSDNYMAISGGVDGAPINLDVVLYEWGQVREPYEGVYGQVAASDVAKWFKEHQNRLLTPNIRMFLGPTDVNESIYQTLVNAPEAFWYFNNGVTALCRTIAKKPIGGNARDTGIFECNDLRIVNGAQTVGAISQANTADAAKVSKARVPIRLIAIEKTPQDFAKLVTRYNNTQNRIDRRDFVALDPEQERIRGELILEDVTYVYKSGEPVPPGPTGFDLTEATVARACIQPDLGIATQAKREIGELWDDIEAAPYKVLFNASVTGPNLWRTVQTLRIVEKYLTSQRTSAQSRARLLAVHGNRFIAHMVYGLLEPEIKGSVVPLSTDEENLVAKLAEDVFVRVLPILDKLFPDAYLASVFKNATKCNEMKEEFIRK